MRQGNGGGEKGVVKGQYYPWGGRVRVGVRVGGLGVEVVIGKGEDGCRLREGSVGGVCGYELLGSGV